MYALASSRAQPPEPAVPVRQTAALLHPDSLGTAPYQYIAYSSSLDQTRQRSGVKLLFAAFVISRDGACMPSWGGKAAGELTGGRAQAIGADIKALRAAGGDAIVSLGGSDGIELAVACRSAEELADAYKQVVDMYNLRRIDFDIEGPGLQDRAATVRRAQAIADLQKQVPELRVWITLPVHAGGFTEDGLAVLSALQQSKVVVSGVNIMAMNYNIRVPDMGDQTVAVTDAAHRQLKQLYPALTDSEIWKAIGIIVMAGQNNTPGEIFTLQDAETVRQYAQRSGIGLLSIWSTNRDQACPAGTDITQAHTQCSSVPQQTYDFLRALTIPAQ